MLTASGLLVGGLVLLTLAADRFVVSAARLSRAWGLSPVLIGALVVGLGTSAPELLVSALASVRGELDLAAGNVVGSNVANVTLVVGTTALITGVGSRVRTIRREGFVMMAAVVTLAAFLWDRRIDRWEGVVLLAGMLVAALALVRWARGDAESEDIGDVDGEASHVLGELGIGVGALIATLIGADLLVRGASRLAIELDISAAFVGLVIVAVGTSLPELATALAAARRNETELVVGNVLGSNLFNSLAVAGVAGVLGPGDLAGSFRVASGVMVGAAALAGFFALTNRKVERWEGLVLLAVFLGFVALSGS